MIFFVSGAVGSVMLSFSLCLEVVSQKFATPVGIVTLSYFTIGEILMGLIVMAGVKNWKTLHIVLGAPFFALLLTYFVLPESPRWLIAQKRYQQARSTIQKAAKINGVNFFCKHFV